MIIAETCAECGHRAPVHKGIGTKYWCKECAHLAPEPTKFAKKPPPSERTKIRFNMGEERDGEGPSSV